MATAIGATRHASVVVGVVDLIRIAHAHLHVNVQHILRESGAYGVNMEHSSNLSQINQNCTIGGVVAESIASIDAIHRLIVGVVLSGAAHWELVRLVVALAVRVGAVIVVVSLGEILRVRIRACEEVRKKIEKVLF